MLHRFAFPPDIVAHECCGQISVQVSLYSFCKIYILGINSVRIQYLVAQRHLALVFKELDLSRFLADH